MSIKTISFTVSTQSKRQVVDITSIVDDLVHKNQFDEGLASVFVQHTTAAVSTAVMDPGTDLDMLDAMTTIMPDLEYRHPHDPAHAPDHILGTWVGPSVTVPVNDRRMLLGTWQRIVMFEFDGPRQRNLVLTLVD
jgi:secondary thiamine-phosphate synthase enzyme